MLRSTYYSPNYASIIYQGLVFISDWHCLGITTLMLGPLCKVASTKKAPYVHLVDYQSMIYQVMLYMGSFLCACRCNILEEPIESAVEYADYIPLELNPFEVVSFILYLKKNT